MAKRLTDTDKYKKPFIRTLPGPYKLLWDYLYHECDHSGIWIVDFEIAQIYLGIDMKVSKEKALELFNKDEQRVFEFSDGKKWFIKPFIDFQYGELNPSNRVHNSVITRLKKEKIEWAVKGLTRPLQGCKDKDTHKDKDKDKDTMRAREEGTGEESDGPQHKPNSLFEVQKFFKKNQATEAEAEMFYYHFEEQGWVKGNGMAIISWHSAAIKWIKKNRNDPTRKIDVSTDSDNSKLRGAFHA